MLGELWTFLYAFRLANARVQNKPSCEKQKTLFGVHLYWKISRFAKTSLVLRRKNVTAF